MFCLQISKFGYKFRVSKFFHGLIVNLCEEGCHFFISMLFKKLVVKLVFELNELSLAFILFFFFFQFLALPFSYIFY